MSETTTDPAQKPRYPILAWVGARLRRWKERHQDPFNFGIHLIGIPMTVVGLFSLLVLPWYWGVGLFVLGYLLQYVGHCVEGNDLGEWAGIKAMLGLPYVAVAPRFEKPAPANDAAPQA